MLPVTRMQKFPSATWETLKSQKMLRWGSWSLRSAFLLQRVPYWWSGCFQWDINIFFYFLFPQLQSVLIGHVLYAMFSGEYPTGHTLLRQLPGFAPASCLWLSFIPSDRHAVLSFEISSVTCSLCSFWFFRETFVGTFVKHSLYSFIYIVFVSLWFVC